MAYYYKKEFFRDWFDKNNRPGLKEELKDVLGTSSGNSLQYWLLQKEPPKLNDPTKDTGDRDWLPLRCILRLLNHYPDLKLSDFIEGAENFKSKKQKVVKADSETLAAVKEAYKTALKEKEETASALRQTIKAQQETIALLQRKNHSGFAEISPLEG